MICGIYEYFISRFSILWLLLSNESFVLLVEDARGMGGCEGTEEDATEQRRGPWYRLVFQPVAKEVLGTG